MNYGNITADVSYPLHGAPFEESSPPFLASSISPKSLSAAQTPEEILNLLISLQRKRSYTSDYLELVLDSFSTDKLLEVSSLLFEYMQMYQQKIASWDILDEGQNSISTCLDYTSSLQVGLHVFQLVSKLIRHRLSD
ncbi:MAG: hypothetical protein ACRDBG_23115 [Waterburya sp.]